LIEEKQDMQPIVRHRISRPIHSLALLAALAALLFLLAACASPFHSNMTNSAGSTTSQQTQSQQTQQMQQTQYQPASKNSGTTSISGADQQIQSLLRSMDSAQRSANSIDTSPDNPQQP
jgi:predicted PurR-regulated permease PerM